MKYLSLLMIFFSLAVFAGEYHHRPKPEVQIETRTSIQSDSGRERNKLLWGVAAGIAFCWWNPFDWSICHQKEKTFEVKSLPGDDK